jgi:WD40 repeat protein
VLYASFSPDSRRIVTSGEDFNAFVWLTTTGEQLTRPLEHEDQIQAAGFSPNGKWVVTASSDRTARIWSSETGDPLTPPLQHLARLVSGRFLANGRRIVTVDLLGRFWLFQLPVDNRPIEDLRKVADLLSGQSITLADGMGPSRSESLERIWHELRVKYPADFTVSQEQVIAWHEFEAARSEREKEWFTAVFHLEALLAARPDDQSLSNRLRQSEEALK